MYYLIMWEFAIIEIIIMIIIFAAFVIFAQPYHIDLRKHQTKKAASKILMFFSKHLSRSIVQRTAGKPSSHLPKPKISQKEQCNIVK